MGIFDEIDDTTIAIDETTILEIKATDLTQKIFQKSSFTARSALPFPLNQDFFDEFLTLF